MKIAMGIAGIVLLAEVVLAGDKLQGSLGISGIGYFAGADCNSSYPGAQFNSVFTEGTSTAKFTFDDRLRASVQLANLSGLPAGDGVPGTGDEVICLLKYSAQAGTCETIVLRGEIAGSAPKQSVRMKKDVLREQSAYNPGTMNGLQVSGLECYAPAVYDAVAECEAQSGSFYDFASDDTQGICFSATAHLGNALASLAPPRLIAVLGITTR